MPKRSCSQPRPMRRAVVVGDYVWLYGGQRRERPGGGGPARRVRQGRGRGPAGEPERRQGRCLGRQQQRESPGGARPTLPVGATADRSTSPAATTAADRSGGLLGGPDQHGRHPRVEAPRRQRPADAGSRAAPRSSADRTRSSWAARPTPASLASSVRANTAPLSPYFQFGLVGATVPGLKIEGEIGQQLGYLNAAGVGTVNFIILIIIGWASPIRPRHGRSLRASWSGVAGTGSGQAGASDRRPGRVAAGRTVDKTGPRRPGAARTAARAPVPVGTDLR